MEIFALLRKHLTMCCIASPPKKHSFNARNSAIITWVYLYVILSTAAIKEIDTFQERTDILFRISSFCTCGFNYLIIVWKTSELLEFINGLDDIIRASKH